MHFNPWHSLIEAITEQGTLTIVIIIPQTPIKFTTRQALTYYSELKAYEPKCSWDPYRSSMHGPTVDLRATNPYNL
jgi:hypothetical protein